MDFIKKTELFFIQLQYCLAIDPEPLLTTENGFYSLALDPETFFKLINDFQIDYPFIPENKIIELKTLMIKENITTNDALKIIQNFKNQYWFFDAVTMFEPFLEKFKKLHKNINKNISEKELNIELFNYDKYLKAKRDKIYFDLVNELNTELIQIKTNPITKQKHENIFCNNGFELFEYILTNHIAEDRGRINDISFYYWKMFNDNYIIQRPFVFVEWFMNFYDKENFQIKTLDNARNVNRLKHYSNSLDWFKLQNQ
jgi:hypothetical protein